MANIRFLRGNAVTTAAPYTPALVDGQIIFALDEGKIYLDSAAARQLMYSGIDNSFKDYTYANNKLTLYRKTDKSDTTPVEIDFPAEQFLDTTKTKFIDDFAFSTTLYPGATDPNLDGKPVLMLVMKNEQDAANATDETYSYSFLNMEKLVDSDKADKITVADNTHEDEIITLKTEGDSTNGYKGNIKASGKKIGESVRAQGTADNNTIPTEGAVRTELDKKLDIPASAVEDNLASFDDKKGVKDSGVKAGGASLIDTTVDNTTDTSKVLATEKAVAEVVGKKASKLEVTGSDTLAAHENEIVLYNNAGDIKTSGKKVATTIRPAISASDPIADDTLIPTEKAVRDAIEAATGAALEWGTF